MISERKSIMIGGCLAACSCSRNLGRSHFNQTKETEQTKYGESVLWQGSPSQKFHNIPKPHHQVRTKCSNTQTYVILFTENHHTPLFSFLQFIQSLGLLEKKPQAKAYRHPTPYPIEQQRSKEPCFKLQRLKYYEYYIIHAYIIPRCLNEAPENETDSPFLSLYQSPVKGTVSSPSSNKKKSWITGCSQQFCVVGCPICWHDISWYFRGQHTYRHACMHTYVCSYFIKIL